MIKKICEQCGKKYEVGPCLEYSSRFCSKECHGKWNSKNRIGKNSSRWKGGSVIKTCEQCGIKFTVPRALKIQRFCSRKCYGKWRSENICGKNNTHWQGGKIIKICNECGVEYEINRWRDDKSLFCSRECRAKWQSANMHGENHPSWKGGLSFEPYCSKFNEEFKESIRDKFNRTCFLCSTTEQELMDTMRSKGKRAHKLAIHHVNYNKDCLCDDTICEFVPLCQSCHGKTSNGDREYWENLIMEKLDVALQQYLR